MLKASVALLEPDFRYRNSVFRNEGFAEQRPMCMEDLHNLVAGIELSERIPASIRDQFDVARNAFIYSWFVYEFATLAEQQSFAALEMALRQRFDPGAAPNTTRSPGLQRLLKSAVEHGFLKREEFFVKSSIDGEPICLLDFIAVSRNHVMHGNTRLLPYGTPDTLRLCANVMDRLFASVPPPHKNLT